LCSRKDNWQPEIRIRDSNSASVRNYVGSDMCSGSYMSFRVNAEDGKVNPYCLVLYIKFNPKFLREGRKEEGEKNKSR